MLQNEYYNRYKAQTRRRHKKIFDFNELQSAANKHNNGNKTRLHIRIGSRQIYFIISVLKQQLLFFWMQNLKMIRFGGETNHGYECFDLI